MFSQDSTQGHCMLGLLPLEKKFLEASAIPEGTCGRGEGLAFLVTSPFCSRPRSHATPEQPHLRNQVTTRQKSLIPSWAPVNAVCNVAKSSTSPQPEEPQRETTISEHIWTHAHRELQVQAALASGRLHHGLPQGSVPWSFHSQKSSLWPQWQLSVPSPAPKAQQDASPLHHLKFPF